MMDDMTIMSAREMVSEHPEIIISHEESWEKYPKHRWIYETTRLLDVQNVPWSVYNNNYINTTPTFPNNGGKAITVAMFNMGEPCNLEAWSPMYNNCPFYQNRIYVNQFEGEECTTAVAIFKGEIKWTKQYKWASGARGGIEKAELQPEISGDIQLRISALVNLHFKKFSGAITVQSYGKDIYGVRLYLSLGEYQLFSQDDPELSKHIIRIYNNRPWGK